MGFVAILLFETTFYLAKDAFQSFLFHAYSHLPYLLVLLYGCLYCLLFLSLYCYNYGYDDGVLDDSYWTPGLTFRFHQHYWARVQTFHKVCLRITFNVFSFLFTDAAFLIFSCEKVEGSTRKNHRWNSYVLVSFSVSFIIFSFFWKWRLAQMTEADKQLGLKTRETLL